MDQISQSIVKVYFLMDVIITENYINGLNIGPLNILKNEPMMPVDSVIEGDHLVFHSILKSSSSSGAMVVSIVSSPSIAPLTIFCLTV